VAGRRGCETRLAAVLHPGGCGLDELDYREHHPQTPQRDPPISFGDRQGIPTLEVRWIRPGVLPASAVEWLSRFPSEVESRVDVYLVGQPIRALSVKIRGGALLEVKAAGEDRGILDAPGRPRGSIQSWRKWSFPIPPVQGAEYSPPDWVRVGKVRRIDWFEFAAGRPAASRPAAADHEGTCAVEVTEVMRGKEPWWTIGFEAPGHSDTSRAAIEAAAALLFHDGLPGGLELTEADSMSYSEWLRPRTDLPVVKAPSSGSSIEEIRRRVVKELVDLDVVFASRRLTRRQRIARGLRRRGARLRRLGR
jgi:hypothetical protein